LEEELENVWLDVWLNRRLNNSSSDGSAPGVHVNDPVIDWETSLSVPRLGSNRTYELLKYSRFVPPETTIVKSSFSVAAEAAFGAAVRIPTAKVRKAATRIISLHIPPEARASAGVN
jgi:hypothetical protein